MDHDWTSPRFREALWALVRRRVPARDAEDVVQSVLAEALASEHRPDDADAARRFVWGIARHKIADYHRRTARESLTEVEAGHVLGDHESRDLLRWAESELPASADAKATFEWLLREGDGEKLEEIAQSQKVPATVVRQRVHRLRKHFRARWAVYAAALGLIVAIIVLARLRWHADARMPIAPSVLPSPETTALLERAATIRREAEAACAASRWDACLERLDAARTLDAEGDAAPAIRSLRERAMEQRRREEETPMQVPSRETSDASALQPSAVDASAPMNATADASVFVPSPTNSDSIVAPLRRAPRTRANPARRPSMSSGAPTSSDAPPSFGGSDS